jgi:hypothetical protein
MSKPRLQLVHSAKGTQPDAVQRRRQRSFRPLVIKGGRSNAALGESAWEAGLELVNLGLLASCRSYVAFLQAGIAVLEACSRTGSRSD